MHFAGFNYDIVIPFVDLVFDIEFISGTLNLIVSFLRHAFCLVIVLYKVFPYVFVNIQ